MGFRLKLREPLPDRLKRLFANKSSLRCNYAGTPQSNGGATVTQPPPMMFHPCASAGSKPAGSRWRTSSNGINPCCSCDEAKTPRRGSRAPQAAALVLPSKNLRCILLKPPLRCYFGRREATLLSRHTSLPSGYHHGIGFNLAKLRFGANETRQNP